MAICNKQDPFVIFISSPQGLVGCRGFSERSGENWRQKLGNWLFIFIHIYWLIEDIRGQNLAEALFMGFCGLYII